MISIKQINEKDIDLCYELDSHTISLWSKKQWANEFKKEGIKTIKSTFFTPELSLSRGNYTRFRPDKVDKINIKNAIKLLSIFS